MSRNPPQLDIFRDSTQRQIEALRADMETQRVNPYASEQWRAERVAYLQARIRELEVV